MGSGGEFSQIYDVEVLSSILGQHKGDDEMMHDRNNLMNDINLYPIAMRDFTYIVV